MRRAQHLAALAVALLPLAVHPAVAAGARCAEIDVRCGSVPMAAFDRQGRLWVVWVQGGRVWTASSDDRGASFAAPVAANAGPQAIDAHGDGRPKIAVGPDGAVYVTWTERLKRPYTGHIRFSRSTDGGRSFAPPLIVNDDRQETGHRFDAIAVGADGRITVAWIDKRDMEATRRTGRAYDGAAIYAAISTDGGASFGANMRVAGHSCECCRLGLQLDPRGLPVLVWRHVFAGSIRDHAMTGFVGPDRPGPVRRVTFDQWKLDGCPHHGPSLSLAGPVRHLAWFDDGDAGKGLFYRRFDSEGAPIAAAMAFGSYADQAAHPSVLAVGRRVHLVWLEFDGERHRLMAMASADGGDSWTLPRPRAVGVDGDHPHLISDGEAVFVSWASRDAGWRLLPVERQP